MIQLELKVPKLDYISFVCQASILEPLVAFWVAKHGHKFDITSSGDQVPVRLSGRYGFKSRLPGSAAGGRYRGYSQFISINEKLTGERFATFYFGGNAGTSNIDVGGSGCRLLGKFLRRFVLRYRFRMTRLDVAYDVPDKNLPGKLFNICERAGGVNSPEAKKIFRNGKSSPSLSFYRKSGGDGTFYIGSTTSDIQVCIYDKAAQMKMGTEVVLSRVEVRLRSREKEIPFDHLRNLESVLHRHSYVVKLLKLTGEASSAENKPELALASDKFMRRHHALLRSYGSHMQDLYRLSLGEFDTFKKLLNIKDTRHNVTDVERPILQDLYAEHNIFDIVEKRDLG